VFERTAGGAWVEKTSGHDAHRTGVPTAVTLRDFHRDPSENLPYFTTRYGKTVPQEAMCKETINELYNFINILQKTRVGPLSWGGAAGNNSDSSCEDNDTSTAGNTPYDNTCALGGRQDGKQKAEAGWGGAGLDTAGGKPYAWTGSQFTQFTGAPHPCAGAAVDGCSSYNIHRKKGVATVTTCSRIPGSATFYDYADVACTDETPFTPCNSSPITCTPTTNCPPDAAKVVFNANGDAVAYHQWTSFGGGALASGSASASLGSLSLPSGSFEAGTVGNCHKRFEGYQVTDSVALISWTFTYHS
jgi:hypothetical protein